MPKNNSPARRQERSSAATIRIAQAIAQEVRNFEADLLAYITLNPYLAKSMVALHFNIDLQNPSINNWRKLRLDLVWDEVTFDAQRR